MTYTRLFLAATDGAVHATHASSSDLATALRERAGAYTVRTCLNVCVLSIGVLMAGSGYLPVLALAR